MTFNVKLLCYISYVVPLYTWYDFDVDKKNRSSLPVFLGTNGMFLLMFFDLFRKYNLNALQDSVKLYRENVC